MACIRLPAMPRSTAEDALIDLWILLEKHGLETPLLTVKFQPNDTICLELAVTEPASTELYRGWAQQWRQKKCPEPEAETQESGSLFRVVLASAG